MTSSSDDRLNMRLGADLKNQIQQAAKLKGVPVSGYAKNVLAAAVARDLQEHEFLILSLRDREAFAAAIIEPIQPGPKSINAAKAFKKRFSL